MAVGSSVGGGDHWHVGAFRRQPRSGWSGVRYQLGDAVGVARRAMDDPGAPAGQPGPAHLLLSGIGGSMPVF
jgi:hypothetical protein